jgi:hypothetical protein
MHTHNDEFDRGFGAQRVLGTEPWCPSPTSYNHAHPLQPSYPHTQIHTRAPTHAYTHTHTLSLSLTLSLSPFSLSLSDSDSHSIRAVSSMHRLLPPTLAFDGDGGTYLPTVACASSTCAHTLVIEIGMKLLTCG